MKTLFFLFCLMSFSVFAQKDIQKKIQTQLIEAEDGSTVELPAGNFHFDASLSLDGKKNITIKGAGMDKTNLNLAGQISVGEGVKVTNASNITLPDFTVQDTKGYGLKTQP